VLLFRDQYRNNTIRMAFIVGPATPADLPALVDLLAQLFAIERDYTIDPKSQHRGLQLLIGAAPERAIISVAKEGPGNVVGLATGQLVISTAEGGPSAWIEDVFVEPSFRGRGIGTELLKSVLVWAAARGATRAQLLADRSNQAALRFYQRLGWQRGNMVMLRMPLKDPEP
jgi:GNAT superfamily N-acetyltransferase